MTNNITNRQLFFMLLLTIFTSFELPHTMMNITGRSSWIPIIIVSIIFSLAAIIIAKLNTMFTNKALFDYGQIIVGKFITYLIIIFYLIYFFMVSTYLNLKLMDIISSNFMPYTPKLIMISPAIILFCYIAYKGITNIARLFEIYGLIFLITILYLCFFMIADGMKENILPIYNNNETKRLLESIKELIIPFGGLEILFFIPFNAKNKKAPSVAFFTILIIGLLYVLIVESTIMILGVNNTKFINDPFIEAMKIIDVPIIERADILYLTFGLSCAFTGINIVLTGILEWTCKIFKKVRRHIMAIIIAIISFIFYYLASYLKDPDKIFLSFAFYLELIASFLIPVFLFIITKIKKLGDNKVE